MNPFLQKTTSTAISITCTNLRGLGITVDDLADKKINRILNLTAEIHILIYTRCDEENFKTCLRKVNLNICYQTLNILEVTPNQGELLCYTTTKK